MANRAAANRPFKFGARDRREFIVSDGEVGIQAQNDGSGNAIYIGKAKVGTATSESGWQISFQVYDGNSAITSKTWPQNSEGNASSEYEFVWDDRAGFTYS
jgi:hypothetical protein